MAEGKAASGLDFEALRHAIERCDLALLLDFYAEDTELSIVNAGAQQGSPFELRGKAEIAKYLRSVFGQKTSHRVEREVDDPQATAVTIQKTLGEEHSSSGARR